MAPRDFRPKDKGRGPKGFNPQHNKPNGRPTEHRQRDPRHGKQERPSSLQQNGRNSAGSAPEDPSLLFPAYRTSRDAAKLAKGKMVFAAQPLWMAMPLDPLPDSGHAKSPAAPLDDKAIAEAHARGEQVLQEDNARYSALLFGQGGKEAANLGSLGSLSASDARFIGDLLYSGGGEGGAGAGATLSDRISALTLLVQSSPLHNLSALDKLLSMCRKKSRQEAGSATRALADWLGSSGGLGPPPEKGGRKLRYFRDQPQLPAVLAAAKGKAKGHGNQSIDQHLALFVFEDHLKKFYFHFLQLLEAQSHDTLPFVRTAAVSQMYHLLRDQSEQEQNLLRLLVNKLGDGERSVASRASQHLLELLNVHPAMKSIVVREVAQIVLHAPATQKASATAQKQKGSVKGKEKEVAEAGSKLNLHARYYGVLTLNQTMLTPKDADVANLLVELYFQLFEELLEQEAHIDKDQGRKIGGDAKEDDAEKKPAEQVKKPRWTGKGKGLKGAAGQDKNRNKSGLAIEEAHSKMVAAILTGVRRAFPFTRLEHEM